VEKRVINQKLESLRNCIARIESKTPKGMEAIKSDYDLQDIISVNLERAVQNCLDIASHIGADFDDVRDFSAASMFLELTKYGVLSMPIAEELSRAAGFRNLLVHRYASIDWERVYFFITAKLKVFRDFATAVDAYSAKTA
jgi:uncharacterized protein YutE (UPF0331/DUF86 family)